MRVLTIILFCTISFSVSAQLSVRLGVAKNFYNINFGNENGYFYGGAGNQNIGPVLDLEYDFARHYMFRKDTSMTLRKLLLRSNASMVIGFHYFNSYLSDEGFNRDGDPVFSNWTNQYLMVPILWKTNIQPFVLDEDFRVSIGMGVTLAFLLSSQLNEGIDVYMRDSQGNLIQDVDGNYILEVEIRDAAEVKTYSKTIYPMFSIDMSVRFKRLYSGIRAWIGFGDFYMKGLESNWNLNNQQSIYFGSYDKWGSVHYSGGAISIGYKIN